MVMLHLARKALEWTLIICIKPINTIVDVIVSSILLILKVEQGKLTFVIQKQ